MLTGPNFACYGAASRIRIPLSLFQTGCAMIWLCGRNSGIEAIRIESRSLNDQVRQSWAE
jgi:hypothetical protein